MLEGQTFPPADPFPHVDRLAQFMRMVEDFERNEMEAAVDGLIALLDARDGDADLEPNGDERDVGVVDFSSRDPAYRRAEFLDAAIHLADEDAEADGDETDHSGAEDDFVEHAHDGPGCPVSDPGGVTEDDAEDPAWTEWQTRGRHKTDASGAEIVARDRHGNMLHEDVEDDDPDTGIEDDPRGCDPESDFGGEEAGEPGNWPETEGQQCANGEHYADDREDDVPETRRPHRDRIRRTRCETIRMPWRSRDDVEYRLPNSAFAGARLMLAADVAATNA